MPLGLLQACKDKSKKLCNKQLINLKRSVLMGKFQTLALLNVLMEQLARSWFEIFP